MLSGGEIARIYAANFVTVEANAGSTYPEGHELRAINDRIYTPVMVFLDAAGKEVFRSSGFGNPREARALCDFVATKQYKTSTYREYLAQYKQD